MSRLTSGVNAALAKNWSKITCQYFILFVYKNIEFFMRELSDLKFKCTTTSECPRSYWVQVIGDQN